MNNNNNIIENNSTTIQIHTIKNGSILEIGNNQKCKLKIDQHFNWFQKKMIKFCFGVTVTDYNE